jgi:hypothetical protein
MTRFGHMEKEYEYRIRRLPDHKATKLRNKNLIMSNCL